MLSRNTVTSDSYKSVFLSLSVFLENWERKILIIERLDGARDNAARVRLVNLQPADFSDVKNVNVYIERFKSVRQSQPLG